MSCHSVYFDHGATTFTRPEVLADMLPYFGQSFGNPSSIYKLAKSSKYAIDAARKTIAGCINAKEDEIYFTGSGSEGDNWALKGVMYASKKIASDRENNYSLKTIIADIMKNVQAN